MGLLRGRECQTSSSVPRPQRPKQLYFEFFAESLGLQDQLEKQPEGVDKRDKKVSAKMRLINKRNSVKVAAETTQKAQG